MSKLWDNVPPRIRWIRLNLVWPLWLEIIYTGKTPFYDSELAPCRVLHYEQPTQDSCSGGARVDTDARNRGLPFNSGEIMEVVLCAAVGTISVNGVTINTEETPNREPVMDWLHTLQKAPVLDAVNDILALLTMSALDHDDRDAI